MPGRPSRQGPTVLAVSVDRVVWTFLNDILHMSFLAGIHVFKAFPAYTTTEL